MDDPRPRLVLTEHRYDDPLVQELVAEVQAVYVVRYGGPDETPLDPDDFAAPAGAFWLARSPTTGPSGEPGGEVVGMAGLRRHDAQEAELKRLYVRPAHRRRGHARALLAAVEERARAAGFSRLVLETGSAQPEALALYTSAGYLPTTPFGHYARSASSVHLAKALADGA